MDRVDCVVVGAGVVGLAVARALALDGHEVVVLERAEAFGQGVSSRSSEVVHSGIYYEPGSWKARLCVAGNALLRDYAREHAIATAWCGKLVVATDPHEAQVLDDLLARGLANGVEGLELLTAAQAADLEPALRCVAALRVPSTGIVDSHGLMRRLLADVEAAGGTAVFRSPVVSGVAAPRGAVLEVGGDEPARVGARLVVNAAGLAAPAVAVAVTAEDGSPRGSAPRALLAKGSYFALAGAAPFSHLVYPVPEPGGLGVHLTLDLDGRARFGPDVQWLDTSDEAELDYGVDPARAGVFAAAVRRYWPGLPDDALVPAFAGVRPKVAIGEQVLSDFRIDLPRPDAPAVVDLLGIESPGLTSALAIGDVVAAAVRSRSSRVAP